MFQGWLLKRSSNENLYLVPLFDAIYNDAEQFVFLNTEAKMEVLSCNKIRQVYFCSSVIDLFIEVVMEPVIDLVIELLNEMVIELII